MLASGVISLPHETSVLYRPVDARTADSEAIGNLGGPEPLLLQRTHCSAVYGPLPPLIDTSNLSSVDPLPLAFATNVGFKLRDRCENAQQELAGAGRRIHAALL